MKKNKLKKGAKSYMKYSGIAFQLAGLMLFSMWVGSKLDAYLGLEKPYILILLMLFVFCGYMYKLYVDLFNESDSK